MIDRSEWSVGFLPPLDAVLVEWLTEKAGWVLGWFTQGLLNLQPQEVLV